VPLGIGAQLAVDHPNLTRALAGPIGGSYLTRPETRSATSFQDDQSALLMWENKGVQVKAGISESIGYILGGKVTQRAPFRRQALGSSP